MNKAAAHRFLATLGHPELTIDKAEGVYYLLGTDATVADCNVERCLHVVRLADLTPEVITRKVDELVEATAKL